MVQWTIGRRLKVQRPGQKGISMMIDLSFAIFIFLLISWSLTTTWSNKTGLLEKQVYEDETALLAERALATLVTSGGHPGNWENRLIQDVNIIGLAETDRVLDENKINRFLGFARDEIVRDDLAAFWSFDIDGQDDSGNGNHGTINGSPTPTAGQFGQAYDFGGGADYISVAHSASLDIADGITIAGWVNPDQDGTANPVRIVAKRTQTNVGGYVLESSSSSIIPGDDGNFVMWLYIDEAWVEVPSDTAALQGEWQHVAGTYDGAQMKIYVNGVLENTIDQTGAIGIFDPGAVPLVIGARDGELPLASTLFDGTIDEPVVFDRALSRAEIQSIMLNGVFWDTESTKQKLLIGANDYYFRLIDPDTGNVVRNSEGEYIRAGLEPDSTWLQAMVQRPVVFSYRKVGEAETALNEAIAELTLYLPYRTW